MRTPRDDPRFTAIVKKVSVNAQRFDKENNAEPRTLVETDQAARRRDRSETSDVERQTLWQEIVADDAARRIRFAGRDGQEDDGQSVVRFSTICILNRDRSLPPFCL